jgi:hypothetical protein
VDVAVNVSQLVLARDVHLNNLGPKSIVGAVQLNANRGCKSVSNLGWGRSVGQNIVHFGCQFGKNGCWLGSLGWPRSAMVAGGRGEVK